MNKMDHAQLLTKKIADFEHRKRIFTLGGNILTFFTCLICLWSMSLVADQIFYFSSTTRWILLSGSLALTIGILIILFLPLLISWLGFRRQADLSPVSREIGDFYPEIRDRLTNMYQLTKLPDYGTSEQLKEYAVRSFYEQVQHYDFNRNLLIKDFLLPFPALLAVLAGVIVLLSIFDLPIAVKRIFNPDRNFTTIPAFAFEITPGSTKIIQGQSLAFRVGYRGPLNDGCILQYRFNEDFTFQQINLQPSNGVYQGSLPNVRRSLEYRVKSIFNRRYEWSEGIVSDLYRVQVLIPPLLSELTVSVEPPAYTGLARQYLESNSGDVLAYPGSMITITGRASTKIREAVIVFADSSRLAATVREDKIQARFKLEKSNTYHIDLTDREGVSSQNPIEYSLSLLEDLYPGVSIVEPGTDVEVPADGALNLLVEGRDDFGFTDLKLNYQILGNSEFGRDTSWHVQPISIPAATGIYFQQNYFWNFALLDIGFEESIKYYVTVRDNDPVRGPKQSRSNEFFVHFPSVESLFNSFAEQQSENVKEIEQVANESEDLKKKLEDINREMKRENKIDWERKKEIETSLKKQQELQQRLDQIQKNLEDAVQKLESAQLLSPELLDKYRQLQQLFQEIATPEMLQALQDLQKSLEKLNDNQVKNALQKLQLNQQQFKERLDRTLELFMKVQLEQQMDQLVQLAKKMVEEQKKISADLDRQPLSPDDRAHLENSVKSQQNLLQHTENSLTEIMQNKMLEANESIQNDLASARDLMTRQDITSQLQGLGDLIRQNRQNEAGQQSAGAEQNLQQLHAALQQARQKMLAADQSRLMSKMRQVAGNLLQLSAAQEELMQQTLDFSDLSSGFSDMANQQQNLAENMNGTIKEIIDLSHETFFIPPELSKSLGKASGGMRKSLEELQNRNQAMAGKSQEQAMAGLNESVLGIQQSMQQMSQSNSALGFEQFMQRLQQMSGQQGQLNGESMNFFNGAGNQGILTIQQQQELRRLAGEQAAIRQGLEELIDQSGNRSDVLGRLDNLAEEMDKVVQEMEGMKLDRQTIERQQQIFSRLLDAQKSMREKDYSRTRQAETARAYTRRTPPGENIDPVNQRAQKLRQDLQRALQEGYYPDYEKIIEDYFKNLNQLSSSDKDQN